MTVIFCAITSVPVSRCWEFEPALNVARVAEEKYGIKTLPDFFNESLAGKLRSEGLRANVFHANNVLADVADLNGFVAGIRLLLRDEGVAVVEVPYVMQMVVQLRVRHNLLRTPVLLLGNRASGPLPAPPPGDSGRGDAADPRWLNSAVH